MGFVDWFFDTVESAGKSIADVVEDTGREIARRAMRCLGSKNTGTPMLRSQ